MSELFVPLILTPDVEGIRLREVCGADEMAVDDTGTRSALHLIRRLLSEDYLSPKDARIDVAKIVTADRDRILAHIYRTLYGPKIASTLTCGHCTQQFDLDFSLDDLLSHYPLDPAGNEEGIYEDAVAGRFRLPTGEDELQIACFAPDAAVTVLLNKCLLNDAVEGEWATKQAGLQAKMWAVAPILNVEMEAVCPECGHVQQILFDMQSFLLTRLKQDRSGLIQEIHCIASHYHWSQQEILALPKKIRQQYVALIVSENKS